jgi:hypothetical protein
MLIAEDPTVTVKCRTTIKVLFLYLLLYLSVKFISLSCRFTSISYLTNSISSHTLYFINVIIHRLVSDCCSTPSEQLFGYIMVRTTHNR